MAKTKQIKVTILMGIIASFVAVFCCMQVASADENTATSDNAVNKVNQKLVNDDIDKGVFIAESDTYYFKNIAELKDLFTRSENCEKINILFLENFDFQGETLVVNKNQTVDINLQSNKLFSSGITSKNLFIVNGTLKLDGNYNEHGIIEEPLYRSSIVTNSDGANFYINNIDFISNSFTYNSKNGGHFNIDGRLSHAEFNNCNFTGHGTKGGVFYLNGSSNKDNHANISFGNCIFNFCEANQGGAIYNSYKYLDINFKNVKILNCHSDKEGGAIYSNSDYENYFLNDGTMIDACSSNKQEGGAIFVRSSYCNIIGSTNKDCQKFVPYSQLCNDCKICNCCAFENGGAIYTSSETSCGNHVTIKNINFINNTVISESSKTKQANSFTAYGNESNVANCLFYDDKDYNDSCSMVLFSCGRSIVPLTHTITNCEFDSLSNNDNKSVVTKTVSVNASSNKLFYHEKDFKWRHYVSYYYDLEEMFLPPIKVFEGYKLHGICTEVHTIPFSDIHPIVNQKVELLDEHDKVIATTETDSVGNYQFTLEPGSKVKVRVNYPFSMQGAKVSDLMEINSDQEYNVSFS